MLTLEQIGSIRLRADSGFTVDDDEWNALCDMAEQAARAAPAQNEIADKLRAVLCDPEGNVCINGSDGDRREIAEALAMLDRAAPAQPVDPNYCMSKPLGFGIAPAQEKK